MKLLNQLSERVKQATYSVDEQNRTVDAYIFFREHYYHGSAICHPKDATFYSQRVGKHIALGRAYLAALDKLLEDTEQEYKRKEAFIKEVTSFGTRGLADIDPSGVFKRNVERAKARYEAVRERRKNVKTHLDNYLKGLKKLSQIVTKYRTSYLGETN